MNLRIPTLLTILLSALFIPLMTYSATDNETVSQTKTDLSNIKTYGCKNLHKVKDIDDLLKQMYDNIDSHCLFRIETKDLAKSVDKPYIYMSIRDKPTPNNILFYQRCNECANFL